MTSLPKGHKQRSKNENPITTAVRKWLADISSTLTKEAQAYLKDESLLERAPKRWVMYHPLVLLPSGSFNSPPWLDLLGILRPEQVSRLWERILQDISKAASNQPLTHLAINEGIPLQQEGHPEQENVLRSPSGLKMLYGDFGPASCPRDDGDPTEEDFEAALWVSTKQNGIYQTWAPRWTMFSRGNVKEKARLLAFHGGFTDAAKPAGLEHRIWPTARVKNTWAVDLYAGIGYFVFSYATLGMRVLCWELSPWSVEGLRRGALKNGWSVRVVQGGELEQATSDVLSGQEQIIVFLENNREASRRFADLRSGDIEIDVSHVNCGFLPSSQPSWKAAWDIIGTGEGGGWLHLHENVGVRDIEARRREIEQILNAWMESGQAGKEVTVEHAELVKTFAPDVWHCVFDAYITDI